MKLRRHTIDIPDADEREAEETVRRLATRSSAQEPEMPSETYFQNLLVRTNRRIDYVTSGRAISLSWLARVAVPGVVAIIFFLIGLHYYAPPSSRPSLVEVMQALPASAVDSLLVEAHVSDPAMAVPASVLDVSREQLAEYFLESENPLTVLELLPEQRVNEVAVLLEARASN